MVVFIFLDLVRFYFFGRSEISIVRFPLGHSYVLYTCTTCTRHITAKTVLQYFLWPGTQSIAGQRGIHYSNHRRLWPAAQLQPNLKNLGTRYKFWLQKKQTVSPANTPGVSTDFLHNNHTIQKNSCATKHFLYKKRSCYGFQPHWLHKKKKK